jgi:hypothetical protein
VDEYADRDASRTSDPLWASLKEHYADALTVLVALAHWIPNYGPARPEDVVSTLPPLTLPELVICFEQLVTLEMISLDKGRYVLTEFGEVTEQRLGFEREAAYRGR